MKTEDKILAARTSLLWNNPFFGILAVQLQAIDATDDPRIDTMATDGKHLFYHAPFVDKLKKDELIFVLAHEVMHNALDHHTRRQNRDPMKWNIAADYAINGELVGTGVGKMPKGGLIDPDFTGLSAEEIYNLLPDNAGSKRGRGGSDPGSCGSVIDAAPAHDEAALSEARAEMQSQVRMAANLARASAAGTLPSGLQRIIDTMTKPKVDWRAVLRRFVDESISRDFSWARPNRRLLPHGLITPGSIADGIPHITVCVDTSGSISDKVLSDFGAEIRGAFEDGAVDAVSVIYADADVQHVQHFEAGDVLELVAKGGGGTRFSPSFNWIREKMPDTKAIIYLSDMFCSDFGRAPDAPVLWGVYGRPGMKDVSAPFGELLCITD